MSTKRLSLIVFGAMLATVAFAAAEQASEPSCCVKRAYCCSIKARCCDNDKTVEAEIIPLTFVKKEAAKPTCMAISPRWSMP